MRSLPLPPSLVSLFDLKLNHILTFVDMSVANTKQGFRHVSVSREQGQVWAISGAGIICRRIGVTRENPAGTGWVTGIGVSNERQVSTSSRLV